MNMRQKERAFTAAGVDLVLSISKVSLLLRNIDIRTLNLYLRVCVFVSAPVHS